MLMGSSDLASLNAPNGAFAHIELSSNLPLWQQSGQGSDGGSFRVGQFRVRSTFASSMLKHALTRTVFRLVMFRPTRLLEWAITTHAYLHRCWFPSWVFRTRVVQGFVCRACHQLKIFQTIVTAVTVDVMDNFGVIQHSTEMFAHHEPLLKYVAVLKRIGMVRLPDQSIPVLQIFPTAPSRMFWATSFVSSDISNILSASKSLERSPARFKFGATTAATKHGPIIIKAMR
jgi:hypothetical protein